MSRTRTKGGYTDMPLTRTSQTHDCTDDGITSTITSANGEFTVMTDVVTDRFHVRSKRGEVIVNPMTKVTTTRVTSGGASSETWTKGAGNPCDRTVSWDGPRYHCDFPQYGMGLVGHLDVDVGLENLKKLAGTEAASNVADPQFHGMVFLAELRETIGFLRNPLGNWKKLLAAARKHQRSQINRHRRRGNRKIVHKLQEVNLADFIAGNWLAYRYAVMPIVYDIEDALAAIASLDQPIPERQTARGYSNNQGYEAATIIKTIGAIKLTKEVNTSVDTSVRVGILYEMTTSDTFGVGVAQVPRTVWEVIPFSFVVDWIANIGDYIGAITPKVGVKVLGSWTVVETLESTTGEGTGEPRATAPSNYILDTAPETSESVITHSKTRRGGHNIGLGYHPIPIEGDIGKKRIQDIVSLTQKLLQSKLK